MTSIPTARALAAAAGSLPAGARIVPLLKHDDARGDFTELFREQWGLSDRAVQWNVVRSAPNVLRGVHVHLAHVDYLTVVSGEMVLGLQDFRSGSPTFGEAITLRLQADDPHLVLVPTGVGHGFYFPEASMHVYGVSRHFDGSDEFGCRWDDPALKLHWPCRSPVLSDRDRAAGTCRELLAKLDGCAAT